MKVSYKSNNVSDDKYTENIDHPIRGYTVAALATVVITASALLVGRHYEKDRGHETQVRIPKEVVNAPHNMQLIDYVFNQDNAPKRDVVKITLIPNTNYDTLINNNNRLVIKGSVNYDIDCKGIDDKNLCNDTRECQLTFKTIDDRLKD